MKRKKRIKILRVSLFIYNLPLQCKQRPCVAIELSKSKCVLILFHSLDSKYMMTLLK